MSWRDTLRASPPPEQSEVSEQSPPESRIVHITQIPQGDGNPAFPPGPATERDFQRVADRHRNRAARLTPDGTGKLIAEAWPGLCQRIKNADGELNRLWLAASKGDQPYPQTFPAFITACRTWTRLNLQGARYVCLLDRGVRRAYSRKLGEWIYIVQSKAAVRGARLKPAGVVYSLEECRALLTVKPSGDELRTIHRAKMMFRGELSVGGRPP